MKTHNLYTVKQGDTLRNIAKRHQTNWQAIFNANRVGVRRTDGTMGWVFDPNNLTVGKRLIVPMS